MAPHLTQCLQEHEAFDVTYGAADLDQADVRSTGKPVHALVSDALDPILHSTSDMRDHLHGLSKVVATPFRLYHALVHLAGSDVMITR